MAEGGAYRDGNLTLRLVQHDREEYDRYYNVFANPTLWFIHHYLWSLALEPSVDRNVRLAWEAGYVPVNERFADAAGRASWPARGRGRSSWCTTTSSSWCPGFLRTRVPDAVIHHFTHIPWPQPDYWRVLPTDVRTAIHESHAGLRPDRPAHAALRPAPSSSAASGSSRTPRSTCAAARPRSTAAASASAPIRSRSTRPSSSGCGAARGGARPSREVLRGAAREADPARRPHRPVEERRPGLLRRSTSSSPITRSGPGG